MSKENEIMAAAKQICEEKNIPFESVIETIEAALAVAYRKDFGEKNQNIKVNFDIKTAEAHVFDIKTVVTDEKAEITEKLKEEKRLQDEAEELAGRPVKPEKKSAKGGSASGGKDKDTGEGEEIIERFNPKTEITLTDAQAIKKGAKLDDELKTKLVPPAAYGRMAAQTAKQVIVQRLREAERETVFKEFKEKEGEIINGTIQRVEGKMVLIDVGPSTALLPPSEQVPHERYTSGQRFKFYLVAVNTTPKGPEIILSRSHVDMVKKLFSIEVPEVGNGSVEIKSISREAGSRTKIAVFTNQKNIDPVGSCVGQRGSRVQTIISEIGGEKIDIVEWEEDPIKYITNALSPAKVLGVKLNEDDKMALVEVKEDQLSLAIGKSGQNVRLSAKLTGWKIDIISDVGEKVTPKTEAKPVEEESKDKSEDVEEKDDKKEDVPEDKKDEDGEKNEVENEDPKKEKVEKKRKKAVKKEEPKEVKKEDKKEEGEEVEIDEKAGTDKKESTENNVSAKAEKSHA